MHSSTELSGTSTNTVLVRVHSALCLSSIIELWMVQDGTIDRAIERSLSRVAPSSPRVILCVHLEGQAHLRRRLIALLLVLSFSLSTRIVSYPIGIGCNKIERTVSRSPTSRLEDLLQ